MDPYHQKNNGQQIDKKFEEMHLGIARRPSTTKDARVKWSGCQFAHVWGKKTARSRLYVRKTTGTCIQVIYPNKIHYFRLCEINTAFARYIA